MHTQRIGGHLADALVSPPGEPEMSPQIAAHHELGEQPTPIVQPAVLQRSVWQHSFGAMLIETCADGSVWIDGKPVRDTLPSQPSPQAPRGLAAGLGAAMEARNG